METSYAQAMTLSELCIEANHISLASYSVSGIQKLIVLDFTKLTFWPIFKVNFWPVYTSESPSLHPLLQHLNFTLKVCFKARKIYMIFD